jgi:hypothetical protein
MKDETGKWISAKDMIEILQSLPLDARIYPNQVGNLNVTTGEGSSLTWTGIIDFMYGIYEPWSENDDEENADA